MNPIRSQRGFTLIEIIVSLAIFLVVSVLSNYAFQRIIGVSGQQARSATSNIEGIVGLELLRYDVEHAGYGLPWRFQSYTGAIAFRNLGGSANREADVTADSLARGFDPGSLNATASRNIRALSAGSCTQEVNGGAVTNLNGGPDYLVVRSSMASLYRNVGDPARKWTYLNYSAVPGQNLSYLKKWDGPDDFAANDRIVSVLSTFTSAGNEEKVLLMNGLDFEVTLPAGGALPAGDAFKPSEPAQVVVAYGILNSSSAGNVLRMPYNRTDYYLFRPSTMPATCNPGTGILYKAVVDQTTGGFQAPAPLLTCVGDLQVEVEYDANDDGNISYLPPEALSALSAADIRDHVKIVRAYVLTHEGKKDDSYSYPGDGIQVGDRGRPTTSGRTLNTAQMASLFTSDWRKYRWKLYTIVTRPKNLVQ